MKSLIASSWRVLEQPPPPTLREILDAYQSKGDGDREMLLAMLNAKSSEDQRLASLATLHRSMLDVYQAPQTTPPVLHVPEGHHTQSYSHAHQFPSPPTSYHHLPHPTISSLQSHHDQLYYGRKRTDSSSSITDLNRDRSAFSASSQQTRKRRRTSRSPPPHARARASPSQEPTSAHPLDLPPSPYSSAQSSGGSPRSREAMTINSLLLNPDSGSREDDTPQRNTSSERSTTVGSRER